VALGASSGCAVGVRAAATDVTATSATLKGYVLSTDGGEGSYTMYYGWIAGRYGQTPTRPWTFDKDVVYPVSEPVSGLDPDRTYHYVVCAEDPSNIGHPYCSPEQTFQTLSAQVGTATRRGLTTTPRR